MSDSFIKKGKKLVNDKILAKNFRYIIKNNRILLISAAVILIGLVFQACGSQSELYVHAYTVDTEKQVSKIESPLFDGQNNLFSKNKNKDGLACVKNKKANFSEKHGSFSEKIYAVVGNSPIKEMVPFISKRNEKVAAFLVAIAKKESGFGEHSPSLKGQDCYNYWGYKGSAGNGSVKGYACFDSAEEAIEIVGNRIEVLVNKNHTTPDRMVNTWKCGTSCKGDPGAPSWVSTVTYYFDKIVG